MIRRKSIPFICLVLIVTIVTLWMLYSSTSILERSLGWNNQDTKIYYYSNSSLLGQQNKFLNKDCIYGHIANMAPICGTDGGCLQVGLHARTHACMHTYIHTYIRTCSTIHTYILLIFTHLYY